VLIETFAELGSTSAALLERLASGEAVPAGSWIIADRQTSGRGRLGRMWSDGFGNFMGSTFVSSRAGDPPLGTLALVTGLAVRAAVLKHLSADTPVMLKWPNDLLVNGAKLSGILLEGTAGGVVIGIGVNLAVAPALADRPTVALATLGGAPDRDTFARDLASIFDQEVERWRTFGLEAVIDRWDAAAHPIGTRLRAGDGSEGPVEGAFAGLAADGALQLRLADGSVRAIHAGEINLTNGS
jgi:BirA family biotin operon repressor/biotin-[acetyl-CoA-carboxylase] ligase